MLLLACPPSMIRIHVAECQIHRDLEPIASLNGNQGSSCSNREPVTSNRQLTNSHSLSNLLSEWEFVFFGLVETGRAMFGGSTVPHWQWSSGSGFILSVTCRKLESPLNQNGQWSLMGGAAITVQLGADFWSFCNSRLGIRSVVFETHGCSGANSSANLNHNRLTPKPH